MSFIVTHEMLQEAGFDVSAAAYERLVRYVDALLDENRKLNLTAARDADTLWRAHVCDSLAATPLVCATKPGRLLDLGSGGGLPGIPIACACAEVQVTLLDSTQKKIAALGRIVAQVGLTNVDVVCGRAEELAHMPAYRERFDLVTARAVAELAVLVEYATGFVRSGGAAWFFKSAAGARSEQVAAESAAQRCGLRVEDGPTYRLPGDSDDRVVVIYRKFADTPKDLPRPVGRARKQPL